MTNDQMNQLHTAYWSALEREAHNIANEFSRMTGATYTVKWTWHGYDVVHNDTGQIYRVRALYH